jgi:hypothetical protein
MGLISRSDFNTGDIPTASRWNTDFNTAYTLLNGNIDASNLADGAVTEGKLGAASVSKTKLGTMEYVISFAENKTFSASGENLQQMLIPYDCTATKIEFRTGHDNSAFVVDIGKADINSSSIGSSFCTASVTASGSVVTVTSLANTFISANTKIIITAKSFSDNCGKPLLINLFVDVA